MDATSAHPWLRTPVVIVCVCHFVREEDVERAYRCDAWTPKAIIAATSAGSTCGCCRQFIEELVGAMDHPEASQALEPDPDVPG